MGKQYDKSFKEEIVKKILHEKSSVPDIAEQYGLVLQTVYKWVRTYKDSGFHGSGRNKNSTENYIRKLEEENKILRKIRHLEKGTDAAFEFIHQHRSQFSVSTMCALLEVSSSGFYKWSKDIKSDQEINQHILMRKTKELYIKHKTKVGSPRLTELLKEQGVEASTATISRILRENKRKWGTEYTAYKNKMRLVTDKDTGEVTVVFPYKDNVWDHQTGTLYHEELAGDEIEERFSNNQLINFKKHTADGTQAISMLDTNDNLLLKGDNLHALHTLREQYKRKVKLIYIDPPYNTQNYKLSYNDSFEDNLYLTFLKNRLDVAIDFLKEDGSIFIHCNVHQQAHIRLLCDEIFGRDNFITQLIWERTKTQQNRGKVANVTDYIIVYAKDKHKVKFNRKPLSTEGLKKYKYKDKNGKFRIDKLSDDTIGHYHYDIETPIQTKISGRWIYPEATFLDKGRNNKVYWSRENRPYVKGYLKDNPGQIYTDFWNTDCGTTRQAKKELSTLFPHEHFTYPKPEQLIKNLLDMTTEKGDIVLDFFLGSGTTAAVAHKVDRKYIGVEHMDYMESIATERLIKVIQGEQGGISSEVNWTGGGSFVSAELKIGDIQKQTTAPGK